jgi:HK97 family phage portal protein
MGLFTSMERRNRGLGDEWYYPGGAFWGGLPATNSGARVDERSAIKLAIMWACIKILSEDSASLPLHLYRGRKSGAGKDIVRDDERYGLLHDQPNPEMTAFSFRETMMSHLVSWGNAYAEKEFYQGWIKGRLKCLWPITPNRVKVERDDNQKIVYKVSVDNGAKLGSAPITLDKTQMLHIPGLSFNGLVGYSPVAVLREAFGLGLSLEEFGARYFQNGINPSMVVSHPGVLKDPTKLRGSLQDSYGGLGKSHRLMLLEEGMTAQKLTINPDEAQFITSRKFTNIDIGTRIYRIPAHMYGELDATTNNNIEQQHIEYGTQTLRPWLVRLEQVFNISTLTPQERQQGYFWEHDMEDFMRGDAAARSTFYKELFMIGGLTPNQIAEMENWNPFGPEGDRRFVPMNMVPLDKVDEFLARQAKQPKEVKSDPVHHGGNENGNGN